MVRTSLCLHGALKWNLIQKPASSPQIIVFILITLSFTQLLRTKKNLSFYYAHVFMAQVYFLFHIHLSHEILVAPRMVKIISIESKQHIEWYSNPILA